MPMDLLWRRRRDRAGEERGDAPMTASRSHRAQTHGSPATDVERRLVAAHRRALDDAARLRTEAERLREENVALRELLRVERLERRRRRSHYEQLLKAARALAPDGRLPADEPSVVPGSVRAAAAEHPAASDAPTGIELGEGGAVVIDLRSRMREPVPLVLDVDADLDVAPATVSRLRPSS